MGKKLIKTHRDLEVYGISFDLAMRIFEGSRFFPEEERYSVADQVRRSLISLFGHAGPDPASSRF